VTYSSGFAVYGEGRRDEENYSVRGGREGRRIEK
jgi:hypothetical protein